MMTQEPNEPIRPMRDGVAVPPLQHIYDITTAYVDHFINGDEATLAIRDFIRRLEKEPG